MECIKAYTDSLKDMKWDDFNFDIIEINTLPSIKYLDSYNNSFKFRDALLKAVEDFSKKKLLKLLVITPDEVTTSKFYGLAFLKSKEIVTVEIKNTPLLSAWFNIVDDQKKEAKKVPSRIYSFGRNLFSSQPVSTIKHINFDKETGAFLNKFIPNQFITEKLAKEKADYIAPFIQLNPKSDFEDVKLSFEKLIIQKELKVIPPKNNDAIYAEFEQEAGFPFPIILKEFLMLHNGVENHAIMSAEKIFKEWKDWQTIYKDWTQEELFDTYSINQGQALPMYVTPYWLPFFDLRNGNFLALDFAPNTKGVSGQVIRFGANQEIGSQEAVSLNEFIKNLINDN
ncbi:SMI1 / KNR4 family protein [Bizionia argentinensis JUB59]|uniref:SMI1 / KNR4 family protein n=1 Tax=Bizionia argentinensis JUB59 TaxID=1046627 RepID=G2EEG5_9FLAO|nr:SMI1/KNR4 family protein [Bizionia argentinensis]EGV43169.1 SMI1 / KNR4 family protein [Bizionia argentinensis JUB59]